MMRNDTKINNNLRNVSCKIVILPFSMLYPPWLHEDSIYYNNLQEYFIYVLYHMFFKLYTNVYINYKISTLIIYIFPN